MSEPLMRARLDKEITNARQGCWCEKLRKPCSYHEGYSDGIDAVLALMEEAFGVEEAP